MEVAVHFHIETVDHVIIGCLWYAVKNGREPCHACLELPRNTVVQTFGQQAESISPL